MLPEELISPILAAAAVEPRKLLGIAQSDGYAAVMPAYEMENKISAAGRPIRSLVTPNSAAAPKKRGNAVCHFRSPVVSECQPQTSITGIAASAGTAVQSDVWTELRCPTRWSSFGIQRPKP